MSTPFCFAIRLTKLVFMVSIGWLMGCQSGKTIYILSYEQGIAMAQEYVHQYNPQQKQAVWLGPPAAFTRSRRTNPTDAPVITGHVDIQEADGKFSPLPGALITIDGAHTFADKAGDYVRVVGPGQHYLRVGGVGLLWSETPSLPIERGDSIQINVHLLPEFRPTMN
jgi:hypothetical protein